jgi:hypothetical protein
LSKSANAQSEHQHRHNKTFCFHNRSLLSFVV